MSSPLATPESPARRRRRGTLWPVLLATLLALPAAAWVGGYFWLNSTTGQQAIADWLTGQAPADRLDIALVRWGPLPHRVELLDLRIHDADGRPLVSARHVDADLRLGALLDGELLVDGAVVEDVLLHLGWDRDGALNLSEALARPEAPKPGAEPSAKPTGPKRGFALEGLDLRRVSLTLEWPTWGLRFDQVAARGGVALRPGAGGLSIDADLSAARSLVTWHEDRSVVFRGVDIGGFSWRDEGFTVARLALDNPDGATRASLTGRMGFRGDLSFVAHGDVALAGDDAEHLVPGVFPQGASIVGLAADYAGGKVSGRMRQARAPSVALGPVLARGVSLPVDALTIVPGLLRPTGSLKITHARADMISLPHDAGAQDVEVDALTMTIRGTSSAELEGVRVASLRLPEGQVGRAAAKGRITFGLTSGELDGSVETDQGVIGANGKLRLNPLSQRLTISTRVAVEDVGGAIADTILSFIPVDRRAELAAPLSGYAVFETRLSRDKSKGSKGKRWSPRTRVTDARLEGQGRLTFDGDRWARAALDEPPRP
ncbi:MAG: hypothetical protein CSA66_03370 [Proteobacteria bacterium]|nr:MAG: hypothetical protein CSA66_03370 [Pseudomonadota bacterium]